MRDETRQKIEDARSYLGLLVGDDFTRSVYAALDALESELSICEGVTRKHGLQAVLAAIKTLIEPHAADLGFKGDFLAYDGVAALVEAYTLIKTKAAPAVEETNRRITELTDLIKSAGLVATDAPSDTRDPAKGLDRIIEFHGTEARGYELAGSDLADMHRAYESHLRAVRDMLEPDRFRGRPIDPELLDVIRRLEIDVKACEQMGFREALELRQRQAEKVRALIEAVYKDGPGITEWALRQTLNLTAEDEAKLTADYWTALQAVIDHGLNRESADVPPFVDEAADRFMSVVIGGPVNRDALEALLTKVWGYNHAGDFQAAIYTLIEAVRMNSEGL